MRQASRVDTNHHALVALLRRVGASVQSLAPVGQGCPDLLVGKRLACLACGHVEPRTLAVEVKDGTKSPSRRVLTPAQVEWHRAWRGQVAVIESEADALRLLGPAGGDMTTNDQEAT